VREEDDVQPEMMNSDWLSRVTLISQNLRLKAIIAQSSEWPVNSIQSAHHRLTSAEKPLQCIHENIPTYSSQLTHTQSLFQHPTLAVGITSQQWLGQPVIHSFNWRQHI
jgi:hypothetical protein